MKAVKRMIALLLTALLVLTAVAVLSACGGFTVTYVLPEGATGTAPASATYAQYDTFKAPEGTGLEKEHSTFVGWADSSGRLYEPGADITMGGGDLTLTAVFEGKFLTNSFASNPGTMLMTQGRFIGPSPAHTYFYADNTWVADAEGGSCFSHWEGTWELSSSGEFSMKLVVHDGVTKNEAVEITDAEDGKCFSFTLSHPGDRGGMKYHTNYLSKYDIITSYNEEFGTSIDAGTEPTFTVTFVAGADDVTGDVPAAITVKKGETVTLPGAGTMTREGYILKGWSIYDYWQYDYASMFSVEYPVGYEFPMFEHSIEATAVWQAAE